MKEYLMISGVILGFNMGDKVIPGTQPRER